MNQTEEDYKVSNNPTRIEICLAINEQISKLSWIDDGKKQITPGDMSNIIDTTLKYKIIVLLNPSFRETVHLKINEFQKKRPDQGETVERWQNILNTYGDITAEQLYGYYARPIPTYKLEPLIKPEPRPRLPHFVLEPHEPHELDTIDFWKRHYSRAEFLEIYHKLVAQDVSKALEFALYHTYARMMNLAIQLTCEIHINMVDKSLHTWLYNFSNLSAEEVAMYGDPPNTN